jgi:hypothetical protein
VVRGAPHRVAFGFASPDDESRSVSPERGAARIARMADTESDRAVAAELQAQADAETPLIATPTSTPVPVVVAGEVAPQQQYVGHGPYAAGLLRRLRHLDDHPRHVHRPAHLPGGARRQEVEPPSPPPLVS